VVGQRLLLAADHPLQRRAQIVAERQAVDHPLVLLEQHVAAGLDAVGLDRGKAEHAVQRAGVGGAVILRHQKAPLGVELLLVGREKHRSPSGPSARPSTPEAASADPTQITPVATAFGVSWDQLGRNDTGCHFLTKWAAPGALIPVICGTYTEHHQYWDVSPPDMCGRTGDVI